MKNTGLADDILDVAVFSLSLMGKNWTDYIIEAKGTKNLEQNYLHGGFDVGNESWY